MVPGCFPGLTRKSGGGLMVSEPKLGTNYSETPPPAPRKDDEGPTDDGDGPTDGPGDGGVGRAGSETGTNLPPTVDLDDEDEGDDDDGDVDVTTVTTTVHSASPSGSAVGTAAFDSPRKVQETLCPARPRADR
jgi:hypothetical protein